MGNFTPLLLLALLAGPGVVLAAPGLAGQAVSSTYDPSGGDPAKTGFPEVLPYPGDEEPEDFNGRDVLTEEIIKNFNPEELRKLADFLEDLAAGPSLITAPFPIETPAPTPITVPFPIGTPAPTSIPDLVPVTNDPPAETPEPVEPTATPKPTKPVTRLPGLPFVNDPNRDIEGPIPPPKYEPQTCRFRLLGTIPSTKKWKVKDINWRTWYVYDVDLGLIIDRGSEQDPNKQLGPGSIVKSNLHGAPIRLGPIKKNWRGYGITSKNFSWDGIERNARFECDNFFVNNDPHYNGWYLDCWYDFDCQV